MNIYLFKAYQTPNLMQMYSGSLSSTPDTTPGEDGFSVSNLLDYLETRTHSSLQPFVTNYNGGHFDTPVYPDYSSEGRSCYLVKYSSMTEGKIVIGFDFKESVFMHAVLIAADNLVQGCGNNRATSKS